MKQSVVRPARKTFRNKYLAVVIAMLAFFSTFGQGDKPRYGPGISGYGFIYKRMAIDSVLMMPLSSSPHTPYRAGGIKYDPTDSTHLMVWTGNTWVEVGDNGTGIDTAYYDGADLVIISGTDTFNVDLTALGSVDSVKVYKHAGTDSVFTKVNTTETFSFVDNNNYPTSHTFNTVTGVFATQRSGGLPDLSVDLDGRYVETLARRNDSVFVYKNGIETFVYKDSIGVTPTLQQVLNAGSNLTENETITLLDSLVFASGKIVVENLRVTSASTATDTSTYKPAALDANGNVFKFDRWPGSGSDDQAFMPNLTFKDSAETLPGGGEASLIMQNDGVTVDEWYRIVGNTTISYRTANNALLDNWGSPTTCTGVTGEFPTVFKIGTTYYMFLKPTGSEDIFLYSSTNKTSWSVINSGNPVIAHSSTATDWYRNLYNVGVAVVGTTMHILVEGAANSGQYAFPSCLGYATADISSPTFTLQAVPQIRNGANPDIHYVPERNALVVLYSHFGDLSNPPTTYYAAMVGCAASLSGNLTDSTGWQKSPLLFPSIDNPNSAPYVADQAMVFTPGKTYPSLMYYNYNQATGYQAYAHVRSPLELLESLPFPDGPNNQAAYWRLGLNGITQPHYPLHINGDMTLTGSYRINDNPIWYLQSTRLTTNQPVYLGNTGTESFSGDNTSSLYVNAAATHFYLVGGTYKMVVNGNGIAINNSSTGAVSGVGLRVNSGDVRVGSGHTWLESGNLIAGGSTNSGKKITVNVNNVDIDGIQINRGGGAPSGIGFGGLVSASAANAMLYSDDNYLVLNSKAGSPLYFNFDNANSASYVDWFNAKMRFLQNGNLMIGSTTDNGNKLQVNGDATVADEVYDATNWNGSLEVPTKNAIRDKIESMSGSTTFDQAIANGNALTTNRTIANSTFQLDITGSRNFADGYTFGVTNTTGTTGIAIKGITADGRGVWGTATSGQGLYGNATSGYGVFSLATTGNAIYAQSTSGLALETLIQPSSTNTVVPNQSLTRATSGTAANGIGQSIDFYIATTTANQLANQIISKWTNATDASRTSQFEIWGVNSATSGRKMALAGTGQLTLDGYGSGTFTGTPTGSLQTTSAGAVIEGPLVASGTYTPTLTNVTNITASTAYQCQYMRVGNVVTVSGKIDIDPVSTGASELGISLPISSGVPNDYEAAGNSNSGANINLHGAIRADTVNDRAALIFTLDATAPLTNQSWFFSFTYLIDNS